MPTLPQEHFASSAQAHPLELRPQQVGGFGAMLSDDACTERVIGKGFREVEWQAYL